MAMAPRSLAILLALVFPAAAFGGGTFEGPAKVPQLSVPVAAPAFPRTGAEFFAGAKSIVDLGGEAISRWSVELARAQPQAAIHAVNIKPVHPLIAEELGRALKAPNLKPVQYDFLSPPKGHATGDRVVLNSPSFGGLEDRADAQRLAASIDAHLEPGGRFYAHGDNLWFMSLRMIEHHLERDIIASSFRGQLPRRYQFIDDVMAERKAQMLEALQRRFGRENVMERALDDYDRGLLNAAPIHTIQLRKPF